MSSSGKTATATSGSATGVPADLKVGAYTEWGTLEAVVVGRADGACFQVPEPNYQPEINDSGLKALLPWPRGPKSARSVAQANDELEKLAELLRAETVRVYENRAAYDRESGQTLDKMRSYPVAATVAGEPNLKREVAKAGTATVLRPDAGSCTGLGRAAESPAGWRVETQGMVVCPRDVLITVGSQVLEASMSKRARYFEHLAYRPLLNALHEVDADMRWVAAPKPSMADSMYDPAFWAQSEAGLRASMHSYRYAVNESEPVWDAADMTRCGRDVFVQRSMTTNAKGQEWLRRQLGDAGLRVHGAHFPYDLHPSHIDCNFVPLRPPCDGADGLVLVNPDRLPIESEAELWRRNGWRFVLAPQPATAQLPAFSQSSKWLSMNLLSLSPKTVVIEENETALWHLLDDLGFDVLTVPFRHVFEFGGSIHCATWDLSRDDGPTDYFPQQDWESERRTHFADFADKLVCSPDDQSLFLCCGVDSPAAPPQKQARSNASPPPSTTELSTADLSTAAKAALITRTETVGTTTTSSSSSSSSTTSTPASASPSSTSPSSPTFSRSYRDHAAANGQFHVAQEDLQEAWAGLEATISEAEVRIADEPVMEAWERPYMDALADLTGMAGGVVLEVGFGLGLSATRIQTHPRVTEHHIIEANLDVYKKLQEFTVTHPTVRPHLGLWQDIVAALPDNSLDTILYDAYPGRPEEQHTHQFLFMAAAWKKLKSGGVFIWCNLTSGGVLRPQYPTWAAWFDATQRPHLDRLGFSGVAYPRIFHFPAPMIKHRGRCEYYQLDAACCPIAYKP
jgi:glycine amidinotransferase